MGSRRARKSFGRVQQLRAKAVTQTISKTKRHATRVQQKAAILTAARKSRLAALEKPPTLLALLSVSGASDDRLHEVASALTQLGSDKRDHPFQTLVIPSCAGNDRASLIAALDAAKVADILLLVFDGRGDIDPGVLDCLDALRAQGLPTILSACTGAGFDDVDLRKLRGRQLAAESLGDDHTLRPIPLNVGIDSDGSEVNRVAIRRIFAKNPREVTWRSRYGYMWVEAVETRTVAGGKRLLSISGWIRGRGFSANELVHLTGYGTFATAAITEVESGKVLSLRRESEAEPIESVAEVDEMMAEQTWPPEVDEMPGDAEDEDRDPGKSVAQEYDDAADDDNLSEGHGTESHSAGNGMSLDNTETSALDAGDEDMSVDEGEVRRIRDEAKDDVEFPDEVDTPIDKLARERFSRYRGLKSLRTSEWDPKEQLPKDYASLFQFRNLLATRKRVLAESSAAVEKAVNNPNSNFVGSGKKVMMDLMDVPDNIQQLVQLSLRDGQRVVVASGMLRHENKRSVVHFGVRRVDSDDESAPVVKAKTRLEMHCGFVRFHGKPMFSENNANSDKHKMERYLRTGRVTVASFYGPATYAPAPALLFHCGGGLIATGSALGADPDRIILKRIILTGYPFKTQKRRAVVRFMFFNPEDIRWFKPVELWTKLGRSGHILEPLGTHGHMKCIFDNSVLHHDTVCMTLYKRVYPKLIEDETDPISAALS